MDNGGRRLDLARGGEKAQDVQKKIVFRLDELIKEMEAKNKPGDGAGQRRQLPRRRRQAGQRPPGRQHHPARPSTPRTASSWAAAVRGTWTRRCSVVAEQWGGMPAEKRAKVVQELTRDLPPKFEPMIKNYFEALDKQYGFKK